MYQHDGREGPLERNCRRDHTGAGRIDDRWFPEFDAYRAAAKQQAEAFDAKFVPFQALLDEASATAPPEYWAPDGVHPTMAGHHLMAQAWLEAVSS